MSVNNSQRAMLANYLLGQHSSAAFGKNYIKNSMAISNTANVTAANSATVARNTTSALTSISDFAVTLPNNTTGYVEWSMNTLDNSLNGQNCEFKMDYSAASLGSAVQAQVLQGGNIVVYQTLTTTDKSVTLNIPCGAAPVTTVRISNVTGNSGTSSLNVANLTYGKATNIGTVMQARLMGTIKMTGCTDKWSTTSTTYTNFAVQTNCVYTTTGEALAPNNVTSSNMIPAIKFASLPAGEYRLEYEGTIGQITAAKGANFRFSDGTNTSREESIFYNSAGEIDVSSLSQSISYTTPQSNVTLQIQAKTDSGGTAQIFGKTTINPGVIKVWYFPSSAQQVYNPSLDNWKVDANISGANPSLGTVSVSTYTGIENASLTLTNNTGSGNLTAQIPCSSTNAPTGTTCSVGNESVGVSFNLPKAGDVLACVSFTHYNSVGQGAVNLTTFQIVETPNNAQTITQEGKSRTVSGNAAGTGGIQSFYPYRTCGNFSFSSAGQKTLRLMYEQIVTGVVAESSIQADALGTSGQRDIHWEVYPITQNVPMPILVNSITSASAGAERIERLYFGGSTIDNDTSVCAASPCTVHRQSGAVSSVTRSSTGVYAVNWVAGTWSAPPICTAVQIGSSTNYDFTTIQASTNTTSSFTLRAFTSAGALKDAIVNIICMGPR